MNEYGLLGDRLESMRVRAKMGKSELADCVGKPRPYISRLLKDGKYKTNLDLVGKLSLVLDCTSDYLLGLSDEYEKRNYDDVFHRYLKDVAIEDQELCIRICINVCENLIRERRMNGAGPIDKLISDAKNQGSLRAFK